MPDIRCLVHRCPFTVFDLIIKGGIIVFLIVNKSQKTKTNNVLLFLVPLQTGKVFLKVISQQGLTLAWSKLTIISFKFHNLQNADM